MTLRTTFLVLTLLLLSALTVAAVPPSSIPAPFSPAGLAAAPGPLPAWLAPGGTTPSPRVYFPNCASVCWQNARACIDGCGGDELCNSNCNYDYNCCVQACDPNGVQCP